MALVALALVGLLLAACGGGDGSASSTRSSGGEAKAAGDGDADGVAHADQPASEPSADTASATTVAVVKVTATPKLGRVLVDSEGMTLYDSHGDNPMLYQFNRPPTPSCYEACAEVWPPLLTNVPPKAIGGAAGSLLGTIRREDGSRQVTYDGQPLYTFVQDIQPGETKGDYAVSFGEEWHALEADGEEPGD